MRYSFSTVELITLSAIKYIRGSGTFSTSAVMRLQQLQLLYNIRNIRTK